MTNPQHNPSIRRAVTVAIYVLIGLIVLVVVVGLVRGDKVQVGVENAGSVTLTGSGQNVDGPDTTLAPAVLEDEIEAVENDLRAELTNESPVTGFGGRWDTGLGFTYLITDFGATATIREESLAGVVSAVGEGAISGDTYDFTFQNLLGVVGQGQLRMSADASQLSGSITDGFTTTPINLVRMR